MDIVTVAQEASRFNTLQSNSAWPRRWIDGTMDRSFVTLESPLALLATRKRSPHTRGQARRARLIAAARELLEEHELDAISLGDVAKHTEMPVSSAYHFYADIRELLVAVLATMEAELIEEYKNPIRKAVRSWSDVIRILVLKGVELYGVPLILVQ